MRISTVTGNPNADRLRRAKPSSQRSGAFADAVAESGNDGAPSAAEDTSVSVVAALIGAQEVETATEGRSRGRAVRRGEAILDQLDQLRREMLVGAVSRDGLVALADTLGKRDRDENAADPHLEELIAEIELRAQVELAKLEARG